MEENHISFGTAGSFTPINGLVHATANGDIPVYRNCGCMIIIPCHHECQVAIIATQPLWEGKFACIPLKHNSESVGFFHKVCSERAPSDLLKDETLHYLGIGSSPVQIDNLSKAFQNKHHPESLANTLSLFDVNHGKCKAIHHNEKTSYFLILPLLKHNPKFQTDHPELHKKVGYPVFKKRYWLGEKYWRGPSKSGLH
jgi:hypothetical protein